MSTANLTLRNVPPEVRRTLRDAAKRSGRSVNREAIHWLGEQSRLHGEESSSLRRSLEKMKGSWSGTMSGAELLKRTRP